MYVRITMILVSVLLGLTIAFGQQITSQTNSVRAEVVTAELAKSAKPQSLSVTINCDELQKVSQFNLSINNADCRFALRSARLNNEELWLMRADAEAPNDKVLAWSESFDGKKLLLYPSAWNAPYILELDVQVTLKNSETLSKDQLLGFLVEAGYGNQIYQALPSGRGVDVKIVNK